MTNANLNQYLPVNPIAIREARALNRQGKLEGRTIYLWTYSYTPAKTNGQWLEAKDEESWVLGSIFNYDSCNNLVNSLLRSREKPIDKTPNGKKQTVTYLSFEKTTNPDWCGRV